jgi:hypothetical protein
MGGGRRTTLGGHLVGAGAVKPAARNAACPEVDVRWSTKDRAASGDLLAFRTTQRTGCEHLG